MKIFGDNSKTIVLVIFIILNFSIINCMPTRRAPVRKSAAMGLQIVRALYGDLTLQAGVTDVTATLQSSVVNNQLTLPAQSKVTWLGDPAPERAKSLLIIFRIGNNVYLKLIADGAGDTISLQTASSAMLLIGQPQNLQRPQMVNQQQMQQAHQPMQRPRSGQAQQLRQPVQSTQVVPQQPQQIQSSLASDGSSMLAGTGVSVTSPGTVSQPQYTSPQQSQLTSLQQRRLEQFRR